MCLKREKDIVLYHGAGVIATGEGHLIAISEQDATIYPLGS